MEQVLTELAQKEDTSNGTVPTPLTNYLDVSHQQEYQNKRSFQKHLVHVSLGCDS